MFSKLIFLSSLFFGLSLWGLDEAQASLTIMGVLPETSHLNVIERGTKFVVTYQPYTGILADISVKGNARSRYQVYVSSESSYSLTHPSKQKIPYSLGFKGKRFNKNDNLYQSGNANSLESTPLYIYIEEDIGRKGFPTGKYIDRLLLTFRFV